MKISQLILMLLVVAFAVSGCREKLPPAKPEKLAVLQIQLKCRRCRKSSTIEECRRINQVLFRCPSCSNIINAARDRMNN